MTGVLYIVSTPIGNRDDITIRALKILKEVDEVICEELKEGRKLLNQYGIDKPLRKLNEHNEKRDTPQIIKELKTGKRFALISDCGTPVFADTGGYLIKEAISSKIQLIPVPGASSLMAALVVSGISIDRFIYYGFLSPKSEGRRKELFKIKSLLNTIDADRNMPVVLLDTPYRLLSLLIDIVDIVGKETSIILCMDMTTHTEEILRGRAYEILSRIKEGEKKREFVLIIKPKGKIPEHE